MSKKLEFPKTMGGSTGLGEMTKLVARAPWLRGQLNELTALAAGFNAESRLDMFLEHFQNIILLKLGTSYISYSDIWSCFEVKGPTMRPTVELKMGQDLNRDFWYRMKYYGEEKVLKEREYAMFLLWVEGGAEAKVFIEEQWPDVFGAFQLDCQIRFVAGVVEALWSDYGALLGRHLLETEPVGGES